MLGDRWITANVWDEATVDVAVRTISENLIAQLPQYLEDARIELDVWWDVEVPKFDGKTSFPFASSWAYCCNLHIWYLQSFTSDEADVAD